MCSRTACGQLAVATLTYVYADSTAVLGPLSVVAEPHTYDLCKGHADRLTAPRGWEVVRLAPEFIDPGPSPDDLLALADAVRSTAQAHRPVPAPTAPQVANGGESGAPGLSPMPSPSPQRGHLRVLRAPGKD